MPILMLLILTSCHNSSNKKENNNFVQNKQLFAVIDNEIKNNIKTKIIMLFFTTANDTNYILTASTNYPPVPVLRKGDNINEKFKTFDIPFYKYRGYYIILSLMDFKLDINNFLFTDSLKHNPQEINDLHPKTDKELCNSIRRPIYNVYYINSEYDIIYLGKRKDWIWN